MVAKIVRALGRTVAEEKRASAAKRVFTVKQRDKRRTRRVTVEDIAKIPGRSRKECAAGMHSAAGSFSCQNCGPGQYSETKASRMREPASLENIVTK